MGYAHELVYGRSSSYVRVGVPMKGVEKNNLGPGRPRLSKKTHFETSLAPNELEGKSMARVDCDYDPDCPVCGGYVVVERYKYGADADGNRYEWRTDIECQTCGWSGEDFERCNECDMGLAYCQCDHMEGDEVA